MSWTRIGGTVPQPLAIPGCLADAGPDSWGRRAILNRLVGGVADFDAVSPLTYLVEAGSDRIGALDLQASPATYVPRGTGRATLDDLLAFVRRVEDGVPVPPELMRHGFARPSASRRELFARMVFNVLCGNTDDHARNHAAFWDGRELTLTPTYDVCPSCDRGGEASQAMRLGGGRTAAAS